MAKKYQTFPGMDDILPGEVEKWQWLENKARIFYEANGFQEIRTPLLEATELFVRSIGQTSDIVHKEMFSFEDRGGRDMTLRPEMTASIARAVTQHGLLKTSKSLCLYYIGEMFRAERPQAGRRRQFHQIGVELINQNGVRADLRCILSLYHFLKYLGIAEPRLKINDLTETSGPNAEKVRKKLKNYFEKYKTDLDSDSLYRLDKNVLRIFDSKNEKTLAVVEKTPWDEIAPLSRDFEELGGFLKDASVPFEINRKLVRGLDYYTGIVFEITLPGLGAQDAVAGGGRYDSLFTELGGTPSPCTGFSLGVERLLTALEKNNPTAADQLREDLVYFAPLTDRMENREYQASVQAALRLGQIGFKIEMGNPMPGVGDHLKKANKKNAKYVVIKGQEELEKRSWTVKIMDEKRQENVKEDNLVEFLAREAGRLGKS